MQYMVAEIQYGGKITDDLDRILFNVYAKKWISQDVLSEGFTFNPPKCLAPIPDNFIYKVPLFDEHTKYYEYTSSFPEMDSPELFGLHPNADLTFRLKEVIAMMNALVETQPKSSGGGEGRSREDIVYEMAADLLEKVPPDFIVDDYMKKIRSLGGLDVPLNVVLFQEIQRLQRVIHKVRVTLKSMRQAIDGEVVMTQELLTNIGELFNASTPQKLGIHAGRRRVQLDQQHCWPMVRFVDWALRAEQQMAYCWPPSDLLVTRFCQPTRFLYQYEARGNEKA